MSEETKTKGRNWLLTLFKIVFCIAAVMIVGMMVLMNMGGNNEVFRDSIEGYISERTGYHAQIGQFHAMTFFPVLGVDFENLELKTLPAAPVAAARIGRVQISFDFWDVMAGNGQIRYVNIEDGYALPGVLFAKEARLERAHISESNDGPNLLKAEGTIGAHPVTFQANMNSFGEGRAKDFRFGDDKPFSFAIDKISGKGMLNNTNEGVMLKDLSIAHDGKEVLHTTLEARRTNGPDINISGEIVFPGRQTVLNPAVSARFKGEKRILDGMIKSDAVYASDLDGNSDFVKMLQYLDEIFGDANDKKIRFKTAGFDMDLKLSFARLVEDGGDQAFEHNLQMEGMDIIINPGKPLRETYELQKPISASSAP